jgi:hypothetical protein
MPTPTYRANVTDKQQADIESADNDSAIRVQSFDGGEQQVGQTKMVKAYDGLDGNAQAPNATGATSVVRQIPGSGSIIGQHNDKPARFDTPGKA